MNDPAGLPQLQGLIERIISLIVPLAFVLLLVMLVFGGFKYLISGGEPKQTQAAQGTITWAILGIILLVVAWLLLKLIYAFTGVDVLHFCIGFPGAGTGCNL